MASDLSGVSKMEDKNDDVEGEQSSLSPASSNNTNGSSSPQEDTNRVSQLSPKNRRSVSGSQSTSPVPPGVTDIRDAKAAISAGHLVPQHQEHEEEPSLQLEDLRRPDKGSLATTATANSSWSQLPVARPLEVVAHESSLSLVPNSGVVQISDSQIDRGELSSIRDNMVRRASDRTNSGNLKGASQLTGTTETSLSAATPNRRILETTNELYDDEETGGSSEQDAKNKKESKSGLSNTTLAIIAALVVLVIAIVAGVCLSGQCGGSNTNDSTTPSPTIFIDRRERISSYIQSITESKVPLVYPVPRSREATNQEKALNWLIDDDPLVLQGFPDELYRVRQRFVLLCIWYWTSPELWANTTDWLSGKHECDWANVKCTKSLQVAEFENVGKGINLGFDEIKGGIPEDLALLSNELHFLQLAYNRLTGTIPTSIGLLTKLTYLDVESNFLSGTLPSELGNLTSLRILRLGKNDFNGTLPEEIGKLTDATVLNIAETQISGTVPSSLGKLSQLEYMYFQDTLLSGSLPSSLGTFENTIEIFLFNTRMNGTVPFCETEDPSFFQLVADCGEVECSCCTGCCPRASGSIPFYGNC